MRATVSHSHTSFWSRIKSSFGDCPSLIHIYGRQATRIKAYRLGSRALRLMLARVARSRARMPFPGPEWHSMTTMFGHLSRGKICGISWNLISGVREKNVSPRRAHTTPPGASDLRSFSPHTLPLYSALSPSSPRRLRPPPRTAFEERRLLPLISSRLCRRQLLPLEAYSCLTSVRPLCRSLSTSMAPPSAAWPLPSPSFLPWEGQFLIALHAEVVVVNADFFGHCRNRFLFG